MQHWIHTLFEELTSANKTISEDTRRDIKRIIGMVEKSDVHFFRTDELEKLADSLSETDNLTELSELMWKLTTSLGFQHFAIFVLKQGSNRSFNTRICTSYRSEWTERYVDRRYQYVDPVMTRAVEGGGWFLFSNLTDSSPAVKDFWLDADAYKIGRNGVCVSMIRKGGTQIGVSFSTQHDATYVEDIFRRNGADLLFLAQIACDAFCYVASGEVLPDDTLTEQELRFLQVLSTSPDPNDALKISSCFGSNASLQASIRSKMGTETVFQAIAIAASKGWFDHLPYGPNEITNSFSPMKGLDAEHYEVALIDDQSVDDTKRP